MNRIGLIALGIALALVGVGTWRLLPPDGGPAETAVELRSRRIMERKASNRDGRLAALRNRPGRNAVRTENDIRNGSAIPVADGSFHLGDLISEEDEKKLNEEERELLRQLRGMIVDWTNTRKELASQFTKLLSAIARSGSPVLRRAALVALRGISGGGSISGSSIGECLLDYVLDADPAISQMAMDQFMEAVSDFTLSDRERAQLVIAAATVMKDGDSLEYAFTEIYNMRHSVAVDAMSRIAASGTEQAKERVSNVFKYYTGDETVTSAESAQQWLAENPDGDEDELFYGGMKESEGIILKED